MNRAVALMIASLSLVMALAIQPSLGQQPNSLITLQISQRPKRQQSIHWTLSNRSDSVVYVYDVFLLGPAFALEHNNDEIILNTAPVKEDPGCAPNHFPPVLLIPVGPGRSLEGDFLDSRLLNRTKTRVVMRMVVGSDAYSVVDTAKAYLNSNCEHSPYDAIVKWGSIVTSNRIELLPREGSVPLAPK